MCLKFVLHCILLVVQNTLIEADFQLTANDSNILATQGSTASSIITPPLQNTTNGTYDRLRRHRTKTKQKTDNSSAKRLKHRIPRQPLNKYHRRSFIPDEDYETVDDSVQRSSKHGTRSFLLNENEDINDAFEKSSYINEENISHHYKTQSEHILQKVSVDEDSDINDEITNYRHKRPNKEWLQMFTSNEDIDINEESAKHRQNKDRFQGLFNDDIDINDENANHYHRRPDKSWQQVLLTHINDINAKRLNNDWFLSNEDIDINDENANGYLKLQGKHWLQGLLSHINDINMKGYHKDLSNNLLQKLLLNDGIDINDESANYHQQRLRNDLLFGEGNVKRNNQGLSKHLLQELFNEDLDINEENANHYNKRPAKNWQHEPLHGINDESANHNQQGSNKNSFQSFLLDDHLGLLKILLQKLLLNDGIDINDDNANAYHKLQGQQWVQDILSHINDINMKGYHRGVSSNWLQKLLLNDDIDINDENANYHQQGSKKDLFQGFLERKNEKHNHQGLSKNWLQGLFNEDVDINDEIANHYHKHSGKNWQQQSLHDINDESANYHQGLRKNSLQKHLLNEGVDINDENANYHQQGSKKELFLERENVKDNHQGLSKNWLQGLFNEDVDINDEIANRYHKRPGKNWHQQSLHDINDESANYHQQGMRKNWLHEHLLNEGVDINDENANYHHNRLDNNWLQELLHHINVESANYHQQSPSNWFQKQNGDIEINDENVKRYHEDGSKVFENGDFGNHEDSVGTYGYETLSRYNFSEFEESQKMQIAANYSEEYSDDNAYRMLSEDDDSPGLGSKETNSDESVVVAPRRFNNSKVLKKLFRLLRSHKVLKKLLHIFKSLLKSFHALNDLGSVVNHLSKLPAFNEVLRKFTKSGIFEKLVDFITHHGDRKPKLGLGNGSPKEGSHLQFKDNLIHLVEKGFHHFVSSVFKNPLGTDNPKSDDSSTEDLFIRPRSFPEVEPPLKPQPTCNTVYYTDCQQALDDGRQQSGIYVIRPKYAEKAFQVRCSMKKETGGWIYVLRRNNGSQTFDLSWNDYKVGFGNLATEFWLGLEKLHLVTGFGPSELLIILKNSKGERVYAKYQEFSIGSEEEGYAIKVLGGYSGNAGDSLGYHGGAKFSTKEKDQDYSSRNCAKDYRAGWWYNDCTDSLLTGLYPTTRRNKSRSSILWNGFVGSEQDLLSVKILVKPLPAYYTQSEHCI